MKLLLLALILTACNNNAEWKCEEYTIDTPTVLSTRNMTYQLSDCGDTIGGWIWYPGIYRLHKSDSTVIDSLIIP